MSYRKLSNLNNSDDIGGTEYHQHAVFGEQTLDDETSALQ